MYKIFLCTFIFFFCCSCKKTLSEKELNDNLEFTRSEVRNAISRSVMKIEKVVSDYGNREAEVKSLDSLLTFYRFLMSTNDSLLADSSKDFTSTNETLKAMSTNALSRISQAEQKRFFSIIDSSEFFKSSETGVALKNSDFESFGIHQHYLQLEWLLLALEFVKHVPQNELLARRKAPTGLHTHLTAKINSKRDSVMLRLSPLNYITNVKSIWIDGKKYDTKNGMLNFTLDTKSNPTEVFTKKRIEVRIDPPILQYDTIFTTSFDYSLKSCLLK